MNATNFTVDQLIESRFTLSSHTWPMLHADFFLVDPDFLTADNNYHPDERSLWTWRLTGFPLEISDINHPLAGVAERLPNHRHAYLSFEGEVSNNRGMVKILDQGIAQIWPTQNNQLKVRLIGTHLQGILRIIPQPEEILHWEFEP